MAEEEKKDEGTEEAAATEAETPVVEAPAEEASAPATAAPENGVWGERIGAFAAKVGKTPKEITDALTGLVGEPSDAAVEVLSNENSVPVEDLIEVLVGVPKALVKHNAYILRGVDPAAVAAAEAASTAGSMGTFTDILPVVPDDVSFVAMLKTGGELKVGTTEIVSAMKAALAKGAKLYDLPKLLLETIEVTAEANDEPVPEVFNKVQKMITQKNYADVLAAIGYSGSFVTQARKTKLFRKLDEGLWPALVSFYKALLAWQESWQAGAANPAMMNAAMIALATGNRGAMPPTMMQPPDTSIVQDAAETLVDKVNRVFSGTGIPVARAVAYEATQVKEILETDGLVQATGNVNKEQMLKRLGVEVTADYVRLETNICKFVLGAMNLPKVAAGETELNYLVAMIQLGAAIPWDKLVGRRISSDRDEDFEKY